MEEIKIVRADSRTVRIKLSEEGVVHYLGQEDFALFAVYEPSGKVLIQKKLTAEHQNAQGVLEIELLPQDTRNIGVGQKLCPGDIVPLKWELEVHIGSSVFSPAVAQNFTVVIDGIMNTEDTDA